MAVCVSEATTALMVMPSSPSVADKARRLAGWDTGAFTSSACPLLDELRELQATAAGQFERAVGG